MSLNNIEPPKKIVFFGDSITQAGVNPSGYITVLKSLIDKKGLGDSYELIGEGIGGNKVYDLYLRHEKDVLSHEPDHVFIWIGVNDVWHKTTHGTGTDHWKFQQFYEALIDKFQAQKIEVEKGRVVKKGTIAIRVDWTMDS